MANSGAGSSSVKHKGGKPLRSGEKVIVLNVFDKLCEKNPLSTLKEVAKSTAELTGVSVASIERARKERLQKGVLTTPGKKRPREKKITNVDGHLQTAIRRKVHSFFFNNEPPTIDKVLDAVNRDSELPSYKRSTFHLILKEIGFEFQKRNKTNVIIDREDIVVWRRKYLRAVRAYRNEGRPLFYMDETWVNEGITTGKAWIDSTIKTKKQAFLSGLSTGLKNPSGKGRRLILVHIGNEDGFLEGGELIFESRKGGDYHDEMSGEVFQNWFEGILPKLPPNSVIIMDNASYHSVKVKNVPNTSWRKADIQEYLHENNIQFDRSFVKAELLNLVRKFNCQPKYEIDNIAMAAGKVVQRLPPYHCVLNPIELVWSQVKGYVASNNKTFKLAEVKVLLDSAIRNVTADKWRNCVEHVIEEEKKMWELDGLTDHVVDSLVINTGESDDDSEDTESDDLEGIAPLSGSD